ncbi:phage tail sheath C-terminal domain-containing protein [Enterobacter roggenkampii]|uniref:phage tail sheath C-terminal domain-containing protein n=1 Tax=Enterobacter roggenkampii TaxID=1812935 RepID=UPI002DB7A92F|nr:phage tail sheath C-terminal domain-containing protein [Enterobacter roggenkampii]MEB5889994.1 phage tail sheath subtilisin-like domain-containing protein [Enterobacter roggenkampii]
MTTNIVPSYPGVYVESVNKLALSVGRSATAVPVFAVEAASTLITGPVRITSWMDYSALRINAIVNADTTVTAATTALETANTALTTANNNISTLHASIEKERRTQADANQEIAAAHAAGNTTNENLAKDKLTASTNKQQDLESQLKQAQATLTADLAAQKKAQDTLTKAQSSAEATATNAGAYSVLDKSLRAYFENGGGYCWLMPVDQFEQEIPKLKDITLLVAAGQNIKSAAAALCVEGGGLFAILDADHATTDLSTLNHDLDESAFTAAYFPWLDAQWNGVQVKDIPPSAVMAGVYCQVDASRGVWKAPANVPLKGGLTPQVKISDDVQGQLNRGKAVNMIRDFGDGTPVVWGARTCKDDDRWRYVPVRRLFNSAERDIRDAMKIAMFEPNSQPTWERVKAAITRYLNELWQAGALAGEKPEEAFFVQCGKGVTMDETDINQGKMIVKIGMAAVRPAEFIILQFTQDIA